MGAPMHVAALSLTFHLEGCDSLKERRQRLGRLRDRFGRQPQVAVCEEPPENLQHSRWHFLAMAQTRPQVERLLGAIEQFAARELDAVLSDQSLEWL